jgi:hypothetical protein
VFKPSTASVRRALEQATSTWGGMYHLFLSAEDEPTTRRLANALSIDVLYAVDAEPVSERLAQLSGYQWRGGLPEWGPFGPPRDGIIPRLLGPEWLLDDPGGSRLVLPRWDPADPLGDLYAVWYGQYGHSTYESSLASRFASVAEEVLLSPTDRPISGTSGGLTPIGLTGVDIEYTGASQTIGIMVLDAQDPVDLMRLWNLRASGGHVFPWPQGHGERFAEATDLWLRDVVDSGQVGQMRSGSARDLGPRMYVWAQDRQEAVPDPLAAVLRERGVTALPMSWEVHRVALGGWTGSHPLRTEFTRTFWITVAPHEHSVPLPIPLVGPPSWGRGRHPAGTVAAQVDIYSEAGLGPDRTVSVPNIRELAALLMYDYGDSSEPFHRPSGSGRAVGVRVDADAVLIEPVSSFSVFQRLLDGAGWTCSISESGRFASRLIELLGGIGNEAGNQPAVRAVLNEVARTPRGRPFDALVQTARQHQGSWPGPLSSSTAHSAYPRNVVLYLLARKLLRPILPVKCPRCATESASRPDDLADEVRCEMCSEIFPLGLALGVAGRRVDWRYRLAGNVSPDRLAEPLPIMATVNILSSYRQLSPTTMPHVIGLQLTAPDRSSEIDVALALNDGGAPLVVVGEVKSQRDWIDANDLANLARVQQHIRSKNIECFVLTAILRESFTPEELTALRDFCENAPDPVYRRSSDLDPILPIVLTCRDLSAPAHSDEHPMSWTEPGSGRIFGMIGRAAESCKRNLGLVDISYELTRNSRGRRLQWVPTSS